MGRQLLPWLLPPAVGRAQCMVLLAASPLRCGPLVALLVASCRALQCWRLS